MSHGLGLESPANLGRSLGGCRFPCSKSDLIEHARQNQAEQEVLDALQEMPDQEFASMADVMVGVGDVE